MANVVENLGWVSGIRQFETTDPVEGGPEGVDNIALSQLASRTKYLYDLVNSLMAPFLGTEGNNGKGWVLFNDIVANIPAGWAEVTEMRGRTAFGQLTGDPAFGSIGNTGGGKTKTLTVPNLPAHSFFVANSTDADAQNPVTSLNTVARKSANTTTEESNNFDVLLAGVNGQANVGQTNTIGNGTAFDVMNPYRVVTYIKWIGL